MREAVSPFSAQISDALRSFSSDAPQLRRKLGQLLDASPAAFAAVVRPMLLEGRDTQEIRYIVALLSARGLLLPMLQCLAQVDRGAAGAVAHVAHKLDPGLERRLARTAEAHLEPHEAHPELLSGLLHSLDAGFRMPPEFSTLRQSPDPRVRARVALTLGRAASVCATAKTWFDALCQDPDPRVRANAVESLWSCTPTPGTAAIFQGALNDRHPRVVANSLIGMYLCGEPESVRRLAEMARNADPSFRTAAAWAMGRTGDPRFIPLLRSMRRDERSASAVIRNALLSIARIGHAVAAEGRRELLVRILDAGFDPGQDRLVLSLVATECDTGRLVDLADTHWLVSAGGNPLWEYSVERLEPPEKLLCGLLLPASGHLRDDRHTTWRACLEDFLHRCRPGDSAALLHYSMQPAQPRRPIDSVQLTSNASSLLSALDAPQALSGGPIEALSALTTLLASQPGRRHILMILDELRDALWTPQELDHAAALLSTQSVSLHCCATARTPPAPQAAFERVARATGGSFQSASSPQQLAANVRDVQASLFRRYRITVPAPGEARRFTVEVCGGGWRGAASYHLSQDLPTQPASAA